MLRSCARTFDRFLADESGATTIEYCLIASIISISIVAVARLIGANVLAMFGTVAAAFR